MSPHTMGTRVAMGFLTVTAALWLVILIADFTKSAGSDIISDIIIALLAIGVPFVFLFVAAIEARPRSVAYVLLYTTVLVSLCFTLPVVITGRFQGQHVILLAIPLMALWIGGIGAAIASFFQPRA